jgi:hypothetical protein
VGSEARVASGVLAPDGPASLNAAWLTSALRRGGVLPEGRVAALEVEHLGGDRGMTGRVVRVRLTYESVTADAPSSVVAKFASEPGPTRSLADRFDLYRREAAFYEHVAVRSPLPTPRVYFASSADEPFVLLLEDIERGEEVDLLEGCSLEQARSVTLTLAEMHARFWNDPELVAQPWLPSPNNPVVLDLIDEHSAKSWATFKSRFGQHMPRSLVVLGNRVAQDRTVLDALSTPPWTLVHGDMRVHNIIFNPSDGSTPVAVIDWQTSMRARAPVDLASLYVTSLAPSDRRTAERELLPEYHAALTAMGVRGYGYDECWRDYCLATINQFSQVIALYAMTDVDERIADDVAASTGARLVAALTDRSLVDLVPPAGMVDAVTRGVIRRIPAPLRTILRKLR